jgi:lysozyme family protein
MKTADLKLVCQAHWPIMRIRPECLHEVTAVATRLVEAKAKARYQEIEKATGVPWFIVAVIHEREASQDFTKQLGQGDPLGEKSTHRPRGMGPYFNHPTDPPLQDAFYRGAVDALTNSAPFAARWIDWTPSGSLTLLILYNGTGYEDFHHMISPYLWGATDQQMRGKYVADGKFDPTVMDQQIGCAAMLWQMCNLDHSIKFMEEK